MIYATIGIIWVGVCVAITLYIIGIGIKKSMHFKIGLLSIALSYIIGAALLIGSIFMS